MLRFFVEDILLRFHFRRNLINYYFACVCISFCGMHPSLVCYTEIYNIMTRQNQRRWLDRNGHPQYRCRCISESHTSQVKSQTQ